MIQARTRSAPSPTRGNVAREGLRFKAFSSASSPGVEPGTNRRPGKMANRWTESRSFCSQVVGFPFCSWRKSNGAWS